MAQLPFFSDEYLKGSKPLSKTLRLGVVVETQEQYDAAKLMFDQQSEVEEMQFFNKFPSVLELTKPREWVLLVPASGPTGKGIFHANPAVQLRYSATGQQNFFALMRFALSLCGKKPDQRDVISQYLRTNPQHAAQPDPED